MSIRYRYRNALVLTALPIVCAATTPLPDQTGALDVVRQLPAPLQDGDFHDTDPMHVALGRLLFFDPILSGNRNISCGACHDPGQGTGDAVALSIGEGGTGQGPERREADGVPGRVPRNAQPLYNLGAREYRAVFHDGRLEADTTHVHAGSVAPRTGTRLPDRPAGLLARQAFFPVVSPIEMAGQPGENPIADAVAQHRLARPDGAWDRLAARLRALPGYADRFVAAFDDIGVADDIDYAHVAEALAAFQAHAFRSTGSRFDRLLETRDLSGWSATERRGLALFYGEAGCGTCHAGPLLSDHAFHAIAMPQIGPGKGHGHDTGYQRRHGFGDRLEDEGRYRFSHDVEDRFRFRTPSLRNVELTGPWGHAGTHDTLADIVRHHLDPVGSLHAYRREHAEARLTPLRRVIDSSGRGAHRRYTPLAARRLDDFNRRRGYVQGDDALRGRIAAHNELSSRDVDDDDVAAIVAFLLTLTDPAMRDKSSVIPTSLPSGLDPQPMRHEAAE